MWLLLPCWLRIRIRLLRVGGRCVWQLCRVIAMRGAVVLVVDLAPYLRHTRPELVLLIPQAVGAKLAKEQMVALEQVLQTEPMIKTTTRILG